jgi:hypothetical protein
LSIEQILAWADEWFRQRGEWPHRDSGPIPAAPGETWDRVNTALYRGACGLPPGTTLPRLLAEHRGVRNHLDLPPLRVEDILAWADAHHRDTGRWPIMTSGVIAGVPGERWKHVENALRFGVRGLPGGSSLARLLAQHRGVRNRKDLPPLTEGQIRAWAEAFRQRSGRWPAVKSGSIPEAPEETWSGVNQALRDGGRGLPGGTTLARLLGRFFWSARSHLPPPLTVEQILGWADAHHRRTGQWPTRASGDVEGVPGERWSAIHTALQKGHRGLPRHSSLPCLLAEHRGVRNDKDLPPLTVGEILAWAEAHRRRTGQWPAVRSGPIDGVPETTWLAVDVALRMGARGLPGGSSLPRLLAEHRRPEEPHPGRAAA